MGYSPYQLVQDFFHQSINSIGSNIEGKEDFTVDPKDDGEFYPSEKKKIRT